MRDGADALRGRGVHPDAFVAEAGAECGGGAELGVDFEDDEIRINRFRIEFQPRCVADGIGEDAGVRMILGQAVDVMIERVERAGSEDAGLAPAAAERFAMSAGLAN